MENTVLGTISSSNFNDAISQEVIAEEGTTGVGGSLSASKMEHCRPSTEMQRLPASPGHNAMSQVDITAQKLQYGLQTINKSLSNQIQPPQESAGSVVVMETKQEQSISLDYKSETRTNVVLSGKDDMDRNIPQEPQTQICFTVSSSVPQSNDELEVHDRLDQRNVEPTVHMHECSHVSPSEGCHQYSKPALLFSSLSNTDIKQSDPTKILSKTCISVENEKAHCLESVQTSLHTEPQPHSTEMLEVSHAKEIPSGMETSVPICSQLESEQEDSKRQAEQTDTATSSDFEQNLGPTESSLSDASLVVALQAGGVAKAETAHISDQVEPTETSLIAEIVHSGSAQEIVVVREEAHISGDWSNVHLNQNYLLQREDGSICEASIVNELSTGESKLYGEGLHTGVELHSQPVEVYEFCGLVEEVAEETICVGSSSQIPHSPGYEVNLFNALLENSEEDLEPSFHSVDETDTIIISQQSLPSSDSSHTISIQNPRLAAIGQHLVLNSNQAVGVAHSGEVCLVQVAAVTSDPFTVEEADSTGQPGGHCSQVSVVDPTEVSVPSGTEKVPPKQEAEVTAGSFSLLSPLVSGGERGVELSTAVSLHVSGVENQTPGFTVVSAIKPEICVSSYEETKVGAPSESTAARPIENKPETACKTFSPCSINPKLLLLNPGDTPLLKHPPSILAKITKQKDVDGKLATAHGSLSGTETEDCLPRTISDSVSASAVLSSHQDQTQCAVNQKSVTAIPVQVQQAVLSGISAPKLEQAASVNTTPLTNKSSTFTSVKIQTFPQNIEMPSDTVTPGKPHGELEDTDMAFVEPNDTSSYPDDAEEDSDDMEQDDEMEESELHQDISEQVSSPEEDSDDDPDADKSGGSTPSSSHKHGQSSTDRKALFLKVRQWISDRVSINSSPALSSTSDWTTPRRERSSLLRGPHGKFVSPSSVGYSSSSVSPEQTTPRPTGHRHSDMAELAKHEADIEHRTQALKREGFWSMKRLSRLTEPPRPKVHWDYLCEEMQWLSADFAQERRWKRGVARKVVRMVMRHHEELRQKEEKAKRDEHAKIRKVASSIAKEVRAFWSNVEKVVQFKQQSRLEEKRKKALDLQLDFIVGQTEKYSDLLSKSLAPVRALETTVSPQKSLPPPVEEDDIDFEPPCEEEDDEETIEVEEQQEGNDAESHQREIELLKEESLLPLDQLLSTLKLPPPQESGSEKDSINVSSCSEEEEEEEEVEEGEDREFTANEEDAEDEEDTIDAQEKVEGNVDHAEELDDLAKEGDMSLEELLEKYKGAYASDFEAPSASGSKASSDSEVSGDEEVENEEDESDVESNSSSSDSQGESGDESEKDEEQSEEGEDDECGDEGMELLLKEGDHSPPSSSSRPKKEISHIAATAESLQPKGYTLATTKVKTPIPFLLHGTLREYQHIGLDWLVTMYEKKLNGILADEMGLGKTIQTIALLAHLACEKGNWGPHLIIVPTSVMLNWEMELKRWCPGFKILTYFGSQKERKLKRQGWTKPNAFHVCITSYKLVLQDHQAFRRKSWRYLILDEAQNIKNFKSQRWQSLLNFNSHRRLLLTGTPLQNSLMELWSLMHFLMPHVFQSHREFKEWFSNPLTGMIEGSQEYNEGLVKRLHKVLRPFLLRRIKADVEKQMPKKYEHVVRCRLSKRQRFLYDDFMAQASTRETLASGHFMSVINILMQLRKVCNHPNLFDPRPIQSPFITQPIVFHTASLVHDALDIPPLKRCDISMFKLIGLESFLSRYQADVFLPSHKVSRQLIQEIVESPEPPPRPKPVRMKVNRMFQPPPKGDNRPVLLINKPTCSVPPAAQAPKPPPSTESTSAPPPAAAPAVQQVVCTVAPTPPPRPPMHPTPQTAVRSSAPKPVVTVRPPNVPCATSIPAHQSPHPSSIMPQRVLLSPDMQARLPSGEVVSIAQLASLAGRPVSSCQGSKPVTFQLQGNKLTLSGAQIHQVPAAAPRPVQSNVMHLVSSGVQHHLISQPAQLTVQTTANTHTASAASAALSNKLPLNATPQVTSTMVSSPGVVKIVVRQSAGKEGGPVPTLAVAPSPRVAPQAPSPSLHPQTTATMIARSTAPLQITPSRTPGPATAHYTIAPPRHPSSNPNQPQPPRPVLKIVQSAPSTTEQPAQASPSSSTSKSSAAPRDSNSSLTTATTNPKPSMSAKNKPLPRRQPRPPPRSPFYMPSLSEELKNQRDSRLDLIFRVNEQHCGAKPVYGREVLDFLTFLPGPRPSPAALKVEGEWSRSGHSSCLFAQWQHQNDYWFQSAALADAIISTEERLQLLSDIIDRFVFVIPPVEAQPISIHSCHPPPSLSHKLEVFCSTLSAQAIPLTRNLHRIQCNTRTQFPDLRLIQYDCGKLQTLHTLLRKLKTGGHRVLIFTQMTRMLDVLEQFLNYHGHIYLRLDGSTRVEQRQALMERFNADRRIFCFILSTRSGGVGVNLTGADTVVFYDSDWNPTMDAQAQDRCHRIGQTRDVHIYRLISERTVEENILKKANQKRMLGDMAIEGGNFTTAFFKQQTIKELFDVNDGEKREVAVELSVPQSEDEEGVNKQSTTILEQALCRAEDEEDIVAASQAKAEQVAELAEFNENIPLDDGGDQEEVEELSKAEQEIAALVEQLTPIERYAMNFLEASLEDVCKEELKQAEEQVEAARKGLDQAKEGGLMLHHSSDEENSLLVPASSEPAQPAPARRGRKPKDKTLTSTRVSGRLRGASPETEPEVPERLRGGLRGRGAASKALSPARDHQAAKTRTQPARSHPSSVPSPPMIVHAGRPQSIGETDSRTSKLGSEEKERRMSESSLDSSYGAEYLTKDDCMKDPLSPFSASSRSPRKRQSADGEVLRGLMDDPPSAKVLRKLPGRLVTVVEEKEPRRVRRRISGTGGGGSSEDATTEDEPIKDNIPPSPDENLKSPQEQDASMVSSVQPPPVRGYPPYSPPHLSPDMPVLRNLPVRRRLETESRMAAQLGEQHPQGRGRGGPQPRKADTPPGKDQASSGSIEASTPIKRKRGRPPKAPTALPEPLSTTSPREEMVNAPPSLKRKRGRPRKDSTATLDHVNEAQRSDVSGMDPSQTPTGVESISSQSPETPKSEQTTEAINNPDLSPLNPAPIPEPIMEQDPVTPLVSIEEHTGPNPSSASISEPTTVQSLVTSTMIPPVPSVQQCPTAAPPVSPPLPPVTPPPSAISEALPAADLTEPDFDKSTQCSNPPPISVTAVQAEAATPTATIETEIETESEMETAAVECEEDHQPDSTAASTSPPPSEVTAATSPMLTNPVQTDQAGQQQDTSLQEPAQTELSNSTANTFDETLETQAVLLSAENTSPVQILPASSEPQTEEFVHDEPERSSETNQTCTPPLVSYSEENSSTETPFPSGEFGVPAAGPSSPSGSPEKSVEMPEFGTSAETLQILAAEAIQISTNQDISESVSPKKTTQEQNTEVSLTDTEVSAATPKELSAKSSELTRKKAEGVLDMDMEMDPAADKAESTAKEEQQLKICPSPSEVKEPEKEKEEPKNEPVKEADIEAAAEPKTNVQKRSLSRQSSQESVRSSSPSSGSSSSTLTRRAHHKKTYENRHPTKRRRMDTASDGGEKEGDKKEEDGRKDPASIRSRSSSSSSDSDSSENKRRLTRSAKRRMQDEEKERGKKERKSGKDTQSLDRSASNNTNTSTGGESGSDTSSVRITRKSTQEKNTQPSNAPLLPPEPEVLGKRCSALNAAAKLLAMKGRVDTPGHTPRKDSGAKVPLNSDKTQKAKSSPATPQSNPANLNTSKSGKQSTPDQVSRSAPRSTRQCPGELLPPLLPDVEYKRPKPEEKEGKKTSKTKEGEGETRSSSRGCSSLSSDGEGTGRSSRSRSSSNSSQRARSISSQNTERQGSRATSSGSERDRDRSPERGAKKEKQSSKDSRRSHKLSQEVTSSSGTEGTPDRVLRSVAALAAVQARSPAASTRSSQQRNKT